MISMFEIAISRQLMSFALEVKQKKSEEAEMPSYSKR